MWDRLRQRESTVPILDRKKLEAWQNSHSSKKLKSTSASRGVTGGNSQYQYAVRGGPAPRWPPEGTGHLPESAQPQNPNYLTAAPMQNSQRDSAYGRPVSSVYSQPSPEAAVFAAQQLRNDVAYPNPLEISPPSSPDIASPRDGPYPGDVSPIDEPMDMPEPAFEPSQVRYVAPARPEPRSNIPMMRRERRKNSDAAMMSLRESKSRDRTTPPRPYGHDVRWDPRTGEPTTSAKGRPSQVNPQEYAHGLTSQPGPAPPSAQSRQPALDNPTALRDRLRQVQQSIVDHQPEPAPRPEWRGASGRTTIVPPVRDNRNVPPLRIPPRSDKRVNRGFAVLSPIESNGSGSTSSPLQNVSRGPSLHENDAHGAIFPAVAASVQQSRSPSAVASPQASAPIPTYPSPPLSEDALGRNRPPVHEPTATVSSRPPSLQITSNDKAIRRKPARLSSGQHTERPVSSEYPQLRVAPSQVPTGHLDEWTQPPSRFSFTTYATSNHTSDEDAPSLPTPPHAGTPTPAPKLEVSILDRGRPIASSYENSPISTPTEPVKIKLDSSFHTSSPATTTAKSSIPPKPHALTRLIPEGNDSTLSVASVLSLGKSLPPAPPEASAKDRVTELNAYIEALGNRRININMAIRKMTEMMPVDNVLASEAVIRKREEERRKVEALRTELADVERQLYEHGLKLHRAYKRLDRDAEYEPTTLWVRRVTG